MSESQRNTIAQRLDDAGLATERFINCVQGSKKSVDHTQQPPGGVSGEYGIYANATDGLVILDIDDYGEFDDGAGMAALAELPPTLEQRSAHGGTHRLYAVDPSPDGRLIAAELEDRFGVKNPNPSWGEVRVSNQYVVGAGSQLDGCDKDGCESCARASGGRYTLAKDREIATITADQLVEVLEADPTLSDTDFTDGAHNGRDAPDIDADDSEILEHALECDEKLKRLWNGNYSGYRNNEGEIDRSAAESALAAKLAFWFQGDEMTVRRMMDRADTKKWADRSDESYRKSILSSVSLVSEYYDPSDRTHRDAEEFDDSEVARGAQILDQQTAPKDPAGELEHSEGGYGYYTQHENKDGEIVTRFERVTNFVLETVEYLEIEGQDDELLTLRVIPSSHLEDAYTVQVTATVFNEARAFREEVVRGRTTYFEAHKKPTQQVLNELRATVGSQPAPTRTGTEFIGLAGEDYDEWVTPEGTLTAEGWAEDPEYRHYLKAGDNTQQSALGQKWTLSGDESTDYDEDTAASVCELLPHTRPLDRGLPILGWFYSAPLKPLIHEWEGEFNLLEVYGDTGSGKTSTIQAYWQAFGADPDPFSASDTAFTVEKHMAESCGLPVWFDEYKPADIKDHRLKRLHRRLREVTRERVVSKGQQDLSEVSFKLRAPVVVSGEQQISAVAVRRRTIMTNVSQEATRDGTDTVQAFGELTGTPYEDSDGNQHDPDGYDLEEHAKAYYRYVLATDAQTLRELWVDARERVSDLLAELQIGSVENTERQGLQTIIFGTEVYRAFASAVGADESELPTDADLKDAIAHVAENIGYDGRRREHTDEFVEMLAQAAAEGYIEQGDHYRVIESRKWNKDVIAFHMPTCYNGVKKFTRDYNLEDDVTALGRQDYNDSFGNKATTDGSYVLATNKRTKGMSNGSKAVYIDPGRAGDKLGEAFHLGAFEPQEDDQAEAAASATPIQELDHERGYVTLTAEVATLNDHSDADESYRGPIYSGTLRDATGLVDWVCFDDIEGVSNLNEGDKVLFMDARAGEYEGAAQVEVLPSLTELTGIKSGVGHLPDASSGSNRDLETATDGGDVENAVGRVHKHLQNQYETDDELTAASIAGDLEMPPDEVDHAIDELAKKGEIRREPDDGYRLN